MESLIRPCDLPSRPGLLWAASFRKQEKYEFDVAAGCRTKYWLVDNGDVWLLASWSVFLAVQ